MEEIDKEHVHPTKGVVGLTDYLLENNYKVGLRQGNIWIERFWKTIKYEYIYIPPEENGT